MQSVLTRRARWLRRWSRSAPMLAAYATLQACILPVYLITGGHDVEITGTPTTSESIVLAIVGLALPLMAIAGWLGVPITKRAGTHGNSGGVGSRRVDFHVHQPRAAGDAEYRSTFLDPLIEDLHTTLVARNPYRRAVALAACAVDGTAGSD